MPGADESVDSVAVVVETGLMEFDFIGLGADKAAAVAEIDLVRVDFGAPTVEEAAVFEAAFGRFDFVAPVSEEGAVADIGLGMVEFAGSAADEATVAVTGAIDTDSTV